MKSKRSAMWSLYSSTLLASMVLGLAGGGCGDGASQGSSSKEEAVIKGTVTVKGKKASQGSVSFDPTNKARPNETARIAEIDKDGRYSVKTLVGDNAVRINIPGLEKDRSLSSVELTYDAKAGENEYNIELPPPGQ